MASVLIKFTTLSLISLAVISCYKGQAQYIPVQPLANALSCFSDKIYSGCNEEYRLTQSGNLDVPPEATDMFCYGPCLTETKEVLHCISSLLSEFQFYNGAYLGDVTNAVNSGCSYSIQRGNFNVASYMEGDTSSASTPMHFYSYSVAFITCWCLILTQNLLGPV